MDIINRALIGFGALAASIMTAGGVGAASAGAAPSGSAAAAVAVCSRQSLDPAPYISVGTNVEQYYNICQLSGWTSTVSIQRKYLGAYLTVTKKDYGTVNPEIRAKLSANCDGTGTRTYRGLFTSINSFGQKFGVYNNWKDLYC